MKHANGKPVAQGELLFFPAALPKDVKESKSRIVGHSETGHHHMLEGEARLMEKSERDPLVCFLAVDGPFADIVHNRSFDTHEPIRLGKGTWCVRRQAEEMEDGLWRQVLD